MNFVVFLLSFCLLVKANESNNTDYTNILFPVEMFDVIEVINTVKNFLDQGTTSYKITRDISLSLYAAEKAAECPSKTSLDSGEILVKNKDLLNLMDISNSTPYFSLDDYPTIATFHNNSARILLDIGSRMGCARLNCSDGYDQFCAFDGRKFASDRLEKNGCVKDKVFPNLCEEQPINYFSMEPQEFQSEMMSWNNQRRAVAKKFNYSAMYELTWSEEAVKLAQAVSFACDPSCVEFLRNNYHLHPKALDPLGSTWIFTHDTIDGSRIFGNTTSQMFNQGIKEFGCVPLDPTCFPDYSYICILESDENSQSPTLPSFGEPCGECPDNCNDGLCVTQKKQNIPGKQELELLKSEVSTAMYSIHIDMGTLFTVLGFFIAATGLALLLVYYLLTNEYRF